MNKVAIIGFTGGVFALLVFVHFFVDWIFQSHTEAMTKHNDPLMRALHCLIYTAPFIPIIWWWGLTWPYLIGAGLLLFLSHFGEDTYIPVYVWAKYMRRPPEMRWIIHLGERMLNGTRFAVLTSPDGKNNEDSQHIQCGAKTWRESIMMDSHYGKYTRKEAQKELDRGGFVEFIGTPMGKILMIAIDQIIHIAFLLPIAYLIARHAGVSFCRM